eukprot:1573752-Pyramimonas_sp.AAC.1
MDEILAANSAFKLHAQPVACPPTGRDAPKSAMMDKVLAANDFFLNQNLRKASENTAASSRV